jgi:hypothetical protein
MRLSPGQRRIARRSPGLLLMVCLTALCARMSAAQVPADASAEPAGGVVLFEERTFEVADREHAIEHVRARLRIESPAGRHHARLEIHTRQFVQLTSVSAEVFDAQGRRIRVADEGAAEIYRPDEVAYLASDARVHMLDLDPGMYPCEIAYSYELEHTSLLFWPNWMPQGDLPVRHASYELWVPSGIEFHTLRRGAVGLPDTLAADSGLRLRWSVADLEPAKMERLAPTECNLTGLASLLIAPDEFVLDDYPGDLTSWEAFGDWYRRLTEHRYGLRPAALESAIRTASAGGTVEQRVRALLELLQTRTRYVAIEVGLGSFQPPSAEQTCARRYGDCKGLATLMIAMCRAAGIAAYPALVLTRDRGRILEDFVGPVFNHELVWVPVDEGTRRDTLWIECTSDQVVPGELPWQCEGCDALMIGPEGSRRALTPASRTEDNRRMSTATGTISPAGDLELDVRLELTGNPALELAEDTAMLSPSEESAYLREELAARYPLLRFERPTLQAPADSSGVTRVLTFRATLSGYWRSGADRVLCDPVILGGLGDRTLPPAGERRCPLFLGFPSCTEYQLSVRVPEGFAPEVLPPAETLTGPGFAYSLTHAYDAGTWRITCQRCSARALVSPEDYACYREAIERARRAEAAPVIFRRALGSE